jgi:hypothetical protein
MPTLITRSGCRAAAGANWAMLISASTRARRGPGQFGFDPAREAEWRDLLAALHRAVDAKLTTWQRRVFVAIVLNNVPLDTLLLGWPPTRTRSTRRCSTPGVSCGRLLPLMGI